MAEAKNKFTPAEWQQVHTTLTHLAGNEDSLAAVLDELSMARSVEAANVRLAQGDFQPEQVVFLLSVLSISLDQKDSVRRLAEAVPILVNNPEVLEDYKLQPPVSAALVRSSNQSLALLKELGLFTQNPNEK